MHTLALRYVPAHGSAHLAVASLSGAAHVGGAAGGLMAGVAVLVVIGFLAVTGSALRGLAALVTELVQVAARITSLLVTVVIVLAVAAVMLVHH
ncbi:MAG TPA: hypothetical protein VII33_14165 [Nakamurella sp.]